VAIELRDRLIEIFATTGNAHGFAFIQVNGEDEDWAYWYADHMQQALSQALGRQITRAEIVVCLMAIENERLTRFDAHYPWQSLYADHFLNVLGSAVSGQDASLSLYYYPECPYCQRVLAAIKETGAKVELRHIWDDTRHRAELQAARGRTTVPVLRITSDAEDRWVPESADIVRYLRELAAT
jgi:glutaredoxin